MSESLKPGLSDLALSAKAWLALVLLAVVMGLLLFVPAGTIRYWQAWVYLSIFTVASLLTTIDLAAGWIRIVGIEEFPKGI